MSTQKPFGSLSNQNVLDIVQELDKLIEEAAKSKELFQDMCDKNYSMYMAQELAYMKSRNLILSKI